MLRRDGRPCGLPRWCPRRFAGRSGNHGRRSQATWPPPSSVKAGRSRLRATWPGRDFAPGGAPGVLWPFAVLILSAGAAGVSTPAHPTCRCPDSASSRPFSSSDRSPIPGRSPPCCGTGDRSKGGQNRLLGFVLRASRAVRPNPVRPILPWACRALFQVFGHPQPGAPAPPRSTATDLDSLRIALRRSYPLMGLRPRQMR